MYRVFKAALFAAGFSLAIGAAAGTAGLRAQEMRPVSLTAFGTTQRLSAWQLSAAGLVPLDHAPSVSHDLFMGVGTALPASPATVVKAMNFAASLALSSRLALDAGYDLDLRQRFDNYDALQSPLLSNSLIGLANGGAYAGATFMPAPTLHLRIAATMRSNRLDSFSFDPVSAASGLPLALDPGQSHSLLAGISWSFRDWGDVGMNAVQNRQDGIPLGAGLNTGLSNASRIDTSALDMTARLKLGNGWIASYSAGLSQLDQRATPVASMTDNQSHSIAIAKHGLFGDDALGLALSRPAPGVLENGFDLVTASGDLPPVFVASGRLPERTPETDLQLGYVTSFLDGALALQTNAAYSVNYQGQTGASAVSLLSRAKIKF